MSRVHPTSAVQRIPALRCKLVYAASAVKAAVHMTPSNRRFAPELKPMDISQRLKALAFIVF